MIMGSSPQGSLFLPKCNNNHLYMYGPVPLLELCMSSTPAQYAIVESKAENETTHREREEIASRIEEE
jgi:hypothetical protein